ncbi:MAG TPA: hypothetical protein VIM11_25790 [Tepidisphaeraceae bacterium]
MTRMAAERTASQPAEHNTTRNSPATSPSCTKGSNRASKAPPASSPEYGARIIGELLIPARLGSILKPKNLPEITPSAVRLYMDRFIAEAAKLKDDPIERLLLQNLLMINFRLMDLHDSGANADSLEAVKIYSALAVRLSGELRRTISELRQYRSPSSKQVSFIKLQAVAEHQNVHYVAAGESTPEKIVLVERDPVEGAQHDAAIGGRFAVQESQPCGSGQTKRQEAAAVGA